MVLQTKFAVDPAFTPLIFSDMLSQWLHDSDEYRFDEINPCDGDYELDSEDGSQRFRSYRDEDKMAFQLVKKTEKEEWILTCVLRCFEDRSVFFIQRDRTLLEVTKCSEEDVSIPDLVFRIFWEEYGGMDGNLLTTDQPKVLRKSDISFAVQLLKDTQTYLNPVVYVTPYEKTGDYACDYVKLAKHLLGMAHVVVEGSPLVSKEVRKQVSENVPMDGEIGIYYPTGDFERISRDKDDQSDVNLVGDIVSDVRDVMSSVAPGDDFSFYKIRYNALLSRLDDLSGDSELSAVYDEIITEKDEIIRELKDKVSDLTRNLMAERSKSENFKNGLESQQSENGCFIAFTEKDLYDSEVRDVILKVLEKEYNSIKDDKRIKISRKVHVLKDILDHNTLTGQDTEIRKALKVALRDGSLKTECLSDLERLGFEATLDGKKHYQLCYHGDSRYKTILSTTPSDYRTGENVLSNYVNLLFGY